MYVLYYPTHLILNNNMKEADNAIVNGWLTRKYKQKNWHLDSRQTYVQKQAMKQHPKLVHYIKVLEIQIQMEMETRNLFTKRIMVCGWYIPGDGNIENTTLYKLKVSWGRKWWLVLLNFPAELK